MTLLGKDDIARVEAAIAAAESTSAGELVVALVAQSDRYDLPRATFAAAWALASALALQLVVPYWPDSWLIMLEVPLGLGWWWLLGLGPLRRLTLVGHHVDTCVKARAFQMFAERGVHQTRDKSGLLIMISQLEHRVVILGDSGIHAHIGDSGWDTHVATITQGIKKGAPAAALIQVIESFGRVLADKFPPRPDDTNELPNTVILG